MQVPPSATSFNEARVSPLLHRRLYEAEQCENRQEREIMQQSLRRTYLILILFFIFDIVWHHPMISFDYFSLSQINWKMPPIFLSEKFEKASTTPDEFLIEFVKILSIGDEEMDHHDSKVDALEVSLEVNDECLRVYRDYEKNYDVCVITM